MKLARYLLAMAVIALETSHAAPLPPALHSLVVSEQRQSTLFLCYTFDDDFRKYDLAALKSFLASFDCYKEWFRVILTPYDLLQCANCRDVAREIGADCKCLESATRTAIGLKYAPSASVFNADGDSMYAGVVLRDVPSSLLVPTGMVDIHYEDASEAERTVELIHSNCHNIVYESQYDRLISKVPVGTYELKVKGQPKRRVSVEKDQTCAIVIEPTGRRTVPNPPSRFRPIGTTLVGLHAGVVVIPFRSAGHRFYKGVTSVGGAVRLIGIGALEGGVLFSSTQDSDFVKEGFAVGGEVAPSFLCIGDGLSLGIKGGYLSLKPKLIGPNALRGHLDYSGPYVGGGIFIGQVGRDTTNTKRRVGLSFAVLYSKPYPLYSTYPELDAEIGGLSGSVLVQIEF